MALPQAGGTLYVTIHEAKLDDGKSKDDPYCVMRYKSRKFRTKICKRGGKHPKWAETFQF